MKKLNKFIDAAIAIQESDAFGLTVICIGIIYFGIHTVLAIINK